MKKPSVFLGLLAMLSLPAVEAANQEIRALFQPDPSQPSKNVFINKTPNSGYCASYPAECAANGVFSIRVPIRFSTFTPMFSGNGVWVKVPADWRVLTVTNPETQETSTVEVRISGIGSRFHLRKPVTELTGEPDLMEAHRKLWVENSWVYAPPPCRYSGVGFLSPLTYQFFWKTPVQQSCNKTAALDVGHMEFEYLDIAYELRTPNPLKMSTGLYTGSLTYSVGQGGSDFNMGPFFRADDSNLTLDFVLDVQHELKVDLPPGGSRVSLEPDGGWQRWLNLGQKPTKVYRDQPFYISASTRFKVWMECGESWGELGTTCNMKSQTSEKRAQFLTKLTLPSGITDSSGKEVTLRNLFHKGDWAIYQPGHYVDRKQGSLRFELLISSFHDVIQDGVGETYSGSVTVIFDSEV